MGQIKKLFEKVLEWGCRGSKNEETKNGIKVVALSDDTFIIGVYDYVEGYLEDNATYVGRLNEAVELRNALDKVIEVLREG